MLSFKPLLKLSDYKSHKVIRVWNLYKNKKLKKKNTSTKAIQLVV